MGRISRALRSVLRHLRDARGVSLYEITAAVAMTGILAAVAVPVIIDKVSEAKQARTVQETDAIYRAMTAFQRDTGKMPGEFTGVLLLVSDNGSIPEGAPTAVGLPGVTITNGTCTGQCESLNTFLVSNPNPTPLPTKPPYPNWRGPYMDEVKQDPFDRSYLVNVGALYKSEETSPGTCKYGWVLSAGPDRILETAFADTKLKEASDDIGKNNGKKIGPGGGCTAPAPPPA